MSIWDMYSILNVENAYKTKTPVQEVNEQFVEMNTDVHLLTTQTFTEPYCKITSGIPPAGG